MIKLHVSTKDFDLTEKVTAYVDRKIGRLDKYLPKNMQDIEGRVILEVDPSGKENNKFVCEAMIEVPGRNLEAREATLNMFAAIDIVEAKLKAQARKLKEKHSPGRLRRSKAIVNRILGRAPIPE